MKYILWGWLLGASSCACAQTFAAGPQLDAGISQAIRENRIPGAVLLVGHNGAVVYRKAYGRRAELPVPEPMTVDTIFDCASLTKVVATTSALMKLFEDGKLRLNSRVTEYLPEFQGGKSDITIRNLMTHFSGLRPDLDLDPAWTGYETGIHRALIDKPANPPGVRFVYSDINFILLGEIVRRLSGQTLPDYVRDAVFGPLGMHDTMFQPPAALRPRIAPTEMIEKSHLPLRGVVHDPTARNMGGIAGHAGLFSTAEDLGALLPDDARQGRVARGSNLQPSHRRKIHDTREPARSAHSARPGMGHRLALLGRAWRTVSNRLVRAHRIHRDVAVARSRVEHLRDPADQRRAPAFAARHHVAARQGCDDRGRFGRHRRPRREPHGIQRDAAPARACIARSRATARYGRGSMSGRMRAFTLVNGKRVGLITNQTGIDREGRRNIDRMVAAGVRVAALFSPEHGFREKKTAKELGTPSMPRPGSKYGACMRRKIASPRPRCCAVLMH